jgi:hypothetical protein
MDIIKFLIGFIVVIAVVVIIVSNKMGKKKSPFLLFAIVDIVIGLLLLAFAIYDFHTSVGEFAGFFGQLALIIGEPVVGGLLLIDIIVWVIYKKNKKSNSVTE